MPARVGDEIVVDPPHTGDLERKGEIIEVLDPSFDPEPGWDLRLC